MAVIQQSFAQQQYVMQLGTPPAADPGGSLLDSTGGRLTELPLVELQGCMVGDGATYRLPPGLYERPATADHTAAC